MGTDVVTWAAIGAMSAAVVAIVAAAVRITLQISNGFADLKTTFYSALQLHQTEDTQKFEKINLALLRLEMHTGLDEK